MLTDPGNSTNKRKVKKDMLWKPLLRGFRNYFRFRLSLSLDISEILKPSSGKNRTEHIENQSR